MNHSFLDSVQQV